MLELGHPMHAHDSSRIRGDFSVRFARPGETVVTLDGLQFTRLAGGRGLVSYRPADIDYSGDAVVGKRIVENLAYVI
jgi:hypothetical protein